ncbi:MAG: GNAT family N-acetyltransferase [Wujia sp.]
MKISDSVIEAIAKIERENFATPWDKTCIIETLREDYNHIFVIQVVCFDGIIKEKTVLDVRQITERDTGEIAGYLIWNEIAGETELLRIAISDTFKRMGLGNLLMDHYIRVAGKSCDRFLLEVRAGNASAIQLYEKYHFIKIHSRKNYYKNPVEDALIYERKHK